MKRELADFNEDSPLALGDEFVYQDYRGVLVAGHGRYYLKCVSGQGNDYIFKLLKIHDKDIFLRNIGVHSWNDGVFPEINGEHIGKVIAELSKLCDGSGTKELFIYISRISSNEVVEIQTYLNKFEGRINYEFGDIKRDKE